MFMYDYDYVYVYVYVYDYVYDYDYVYVYDYYSIIPWRRRGRGSQVTWPTATGNSIK